MPSARGLIFGIILIVLGLSIVPTVWNGVYGTDGVLACQENNASYLATDCLGNACGSTCCFRCVNGTSRTILQLVPLIYVGAVLIGGIMMAKYG